MLVPLPFTKPAALINVSSTTKHHSFALPHGFPRLVKSEVDAPDKDDPVNSAYITERIEANWNRPPSARRGMEAKLLITLVPTGQVISVKLLKKSGNIAFDRSAEQAVYKVGSFDKLQQLDIRTFEKSFRKFQLVFKPNDLRL